MTLSKKELSSVVHLLNDTVVRLIDAVDNDVTLTAHETAAMRNALCREISGMNMDDILQMDKNARRLLLKRGSGAENDGYVGLLGEVTVDTDNQTLRVHDGATVGGVPVARMADIPDMSSADYVVAWQNPNAENDYMWYRRYKSGWVEMGGWLKEQSIAAGSSKTQNVVFPVPMQDTNYVVTFGALSGTYSNAVLTNATTTGAEFTQSNRAGSGNATVQHTWLLCGVAL